MAGSLWRTGVFALSLAVTEAACGQSNPCGNLPHTDHPLAKIQSGGLNATIFLPDKERGYYRSSRFDWSGIVGCVSLRGHRFFGEWFDDYDPLINDAVTGPAEEFRSPMNEIGYDEAGPGGDFLKVGVGILRRKDASAYHFGTVYPIVDAGNWKVKVHKDSVAFTQELRSSIGYGYVYEKVVKVDKNGTVLRLTHKLTNIGTKSIDTAVYDHDFFMLDGKTTGPGMEIRLPFVPTPDQPLPNAVKIDGKTIRFVSELSPKAGLGAYLTGYSDKVSDYDITFADTATGLSIEQTSDSPISRMYLWGTPKTVCPEAYIAIHVPPAKTQQWSILYHFEAK
jgi:hypothetical protein